MGRGRTTGKAKNGKSSATRKYGGKAAGKTAGNRHSAGGHSSGRQGEAGKRRQPPLSQNTYAAFSALEEQQASCLASEEDNALMAFLGDTLRKANRPLGIDELLRITKLPRRAKKHLEYLLFFMQDQGLALKGSTGWSSPAKLRYEEGLVSIQRGGMGFVSPIGKKGHDIFIPPSGINGAWPGDRVRVLVLPGRRGPSPEGRVMAVLEKADREIAVTALREQEKALWACAPVDQRIQALFIAATGGLSREVQEGDLLLLRPGERIGPNLWKADATVNLEREESPDAQERLVKSSHNIPGSFPHAVLCEAAAFPPDPDERDFAGRKRLEDVNFVTIDGRHARDFDDAIHVEEHGEGFRLRVAIADVSHYVRQSSHLDEEARLRGNSYYFPLSVEPMLPEALSNGLCSLRPDVPRLVMVAEILFTREGARLGAAFYPAVIVSRARLTYGQVEKALLLGDAEELRKIETVMPMLRRAEVLARSIMAARKRRGSLEFDLPEAEVVFDEKGDISAIVPRRRHFGHKLIEEFMIAANEAVAEFLHERGAGALYRVHQPPDPDKLSALMKYLEMSGLAAGSQSFAPRRRKIASPAGPVELGNILESVKGKIEEYTVNRLLLRSMMRARYEPDNEGHFGLASACYCHFTSPIRRYADLVVHRALKHALGVTASAYSQNEDAGEIKPYTRTHLHAIADHINDCEHTAAEAEREILRRLAILLLKDRLGEKFEGVVSGLAEFGIFVELPSIMIDGLVPLSNLKDDFYQYLPDRQELRGTGTGRIFRLGQPVSVVIADVNLARQEVNLELLSKKKRGARA